MVIISVPLLTKNVIIPTIKYNEAVALMESGLYDEATETFYNLGDYKDSSEKIDEIIEIKNDIAYNKAVVLMESGSYDEAIKAFKDLGEYKDASGKIIMIKNDIAYNKAIALMENSSYDEAIEAFKNLGDYKDAPKKLAEVSLLKIKSGNIKVREKIRFGKYIWRVLDIQSNSAMLITEEVIVEEPYNTDQEDITWEKSTIRQYLNNEFYNTFSEEEKAMIKETDIVNSNNLEYGTSEDNNTKDKVFLLSIDEVNKYFKLGMSTKNMIAYNNGNACYWWLRSPGELPYSAACVNTAGNIDFSGSYISSEEGIRPALNLEF